MLREMGRKTACCFQRCAGLDCMNTVYAITYDLDQEFGTRYHNRFVDFIKYIQSNDLVPAACMTDTKRDRSLRRQTGGPTSTCICRRKNR